MIKVLHYAPGFRSGGIESRMLDWYRNMDRNKVQFVLVKLNSQDDTPYIRELLALGGKCYNLPSFDLKHAFGFERKLINIIKTEKIDIVHVHDPNSGLFALRAANKCNIPCRILHSRTTAFLPNEKNVLIKKTLMKHTPKYATDYWACSKEAGLWGCGKEHKNDVVVINNGIQDELFIFDEKKRNELREELHIQDKIVVGSIGRLSPQKNIPFLLDIMSKLIEKNRDYVLFLVGEGDESIINNYYINTKDISSNVILAGPKKNVWDYYMAMDVFCGTSLYEGFGTTAIEAQATGVPTLLSKAFPPVVEVTSFVRRLETNDVMPWIDNIHLYEGKRFPEEGINGVINHGYSAHKVVTAK